jgi:hypothetical protein
MEKKSVYLGYTEEEVKRMENNYFVLQFGGDFVLEDSYYLFSKGEASKLYNKTLKNLISLIADGSEKDKNFALNLIGGLAIKPVRLH